MKFIHCSDIHLDSKIDGLPFDKSEIRREEVLHTFERMTCFAQENGVTAVIISGDMFDSSCITEKTRSRVLHAINSTPNVEYLYLSGNHDEKFIANSKDLPCNLKIFKDEWTTFSFGNVSISGIVLSPSNIKSIYSSLSLDKNSVNIVAMHGLIAGYKTDSDAEIISISLLKEKNIDYLALGHIHSYKEGEIDNRGTYAYSGCLDGRGFDEIGEKGFILLNVEGNKIEKEFVPFSSRKICEFTFDVTGFDSYLVARDELLKKIDDDIDKSSIVKVLLRGWRKVNFDIDKKGLELMLLERFFFVKVYDETDLEINIDDYANDKSVSGEFIRLILESDMSNQNKKRVIMCGIKALKGEEF